MYNDIRDRNGRTIGRSIVLDLVTARVNCSPVAGPPKITWGRPLPFNRHLAKFLDLFVAKGTGSAQGTDGALLYEDMP